MPRISITFNLDTLEKIVYSPGEILADYEEFWKTDRSMVLTKGWADSVNKEIDYSIWKEKLAEWAHLNEEERVRHPIYTAAVKIMQSKTFFEKRAIPHLRSFLSEDAEMEVPVDFTAFIPCNAFAWRDVVINVADPHWGHDPTRILNIIMHEVFHGAHSWYRQYYPRGSYGSEMLLLIFRNLQGEGICNYVSYTGQKVFPVPDERDYRMLEDPEEVLKAISRINEILRKAESAEKDAENTVRTLSWEVGVKQRAYYVAGSYMWKVIDEKLGRETLKRILAVDYTTFIYVYNSLVEPALQVVLPRLHFTPEKGGGFPKVTLREINGENLNCIMNLEVKPDQKNLVASNARSIAQAHYNDNAYFRAIYADEDPVGFIMLADPGHFPNQKEYYYLWRLMIDGRYQGRGYGKAALDRLCEYVRTRPNAHFLYGSYHPGENGPGDFYKRYGFEDIDEMFGNEQGMRLKL